MGALDNQVSRPVNELTFFLGVRSPQNENEMISRCVELRDDAIGEELPPLIGVRPGPSVFNGEDAVQKKYALSCPGL